MTRVDLPQVVFLSDEVGQTSDEVGLKRATKSRGDERFPPHWTPTKTDFEKVYDERRDARKAVIPTYAVSERSFSALKRAKRICAQQRETLD